MFYAIQLQKREKNLLTLFTIKLLLLLNKSNSLTPELYANIEIKSIVVGKKIHDCLFSVMKYRNDFLPIVYFVIPPVLS